MGCRTVGVPQLLPWEPFYLLNVMPALNGWHTVVLDLQPDVGVVFDHAGHGLYLGQSSAVLGEDHPLFSGCIGLVAPLHPGATDLRRVQCGAGSGDNQRKGTIRVF